MASEVLRDLIEEPVAGYWGVDNRGRGTTCACRVVRNGDVAKGGRILASELPVRWFTDRELEKADVRPTDAVLVSSGAYTGNVGRVIQGDVAEQVIASNFVRRLRARSGIDAGWLFHLLRSSIVQQSVWPHTGGSAIPNLGTSFYTGAAVPFVPLPAQQRRIAEILDTIDEAIRKTEQVITKLQQMKQGLLHDLLTRGIDENGELRDPERHPEQFQDSPLGRIPKAWDSPLRLDHMERAGVLSLGRGDVISAIDIEQTPGPYPIYSSAAQNDGEFGRYGRFMFDEELITWSVDGGGHPFHRPAHRFSVTNVCGFMRLHDLSRWDYRFVHASMALQHARIKFDWLMKAHPSVIRELYWFARPTKEEQMRIAGIRDTHTSRVSSERRELLKLRTLKNGLMDDLLTGRVRVRVPEEAAK